MKLNEFLKIIEHLHGGKDEEKGWDWLLRELKVILNVDSVFFAKVVDENTFNCFSSDDVNPPFLALRNSVAHHTIKLKKTIKIDNYPKSKYAKDYWIDKGVKSIISVPVIFSGEVFGALQIVSFSSSQIEDSVVDTLKAFAEIVSFVLYYRRKTESTDKILKFMVREFEYFYSRELPDFFDKENLKKWIVEYLINIMDITDSYAVGFGFPKEQIFVAVNKKGSGFEERFFTEITKEVKDLILYKIWKKSIGNIVSFDELSNYGIQPSKMSLDASIKSALFVPVKYNDEVVVVLGFGYDRKLYVDRDYKLALQNCATHLTFMLLAAKNLTLLNSELIDVEESFLESFILVMEARDVYTKGHSLRVAHYASVIGKALGVSEKEQKKLYIAGLLHDIGKIGIPDNILLKPGILSPNEYEIIKNHAEFSYQIIKNIKRFEDITDYVRYHHERCDGSGYPKGLRGKEIPLGARILAIADVFDAVTTTRPYRKKLSVVSALELLVDMGKALDQDIVKKSANVLNEAFDRVQGRIGKRDFLPEDIDSVRQNIFTTDYMTGLLRRKQFVEKVDGLIRNFERFYMFYFDIKNLSYINHVYSMDIGDKIILYTAEALKGLDDVNFLARTEPDAFYFIYKGKNEPGVFVLGLKRIVKSYVIDNLLKEEINISSWKKVIDFYVSFSEFLPGRSAEDMMYECKQRKKEIEELLL